MEFSIKRERILRGIQRVLWTSTHIISQHSPLDVHKQILCLIKTLLGKTQWDKNLVKEKEYTTYIKATSLKTLPGKPCGTKPWLRKNEYSIMFTPPRNNINLISYDNIISFTPPDNNITHYLVISIEYTE